MFVDELNITYNKISGSYPDNSVRKNYFLAACMVYIQRESPHMDEEELGAIMTDMDMRSPYGGFIGMGKSKWDGRLRKLKIIRYYYGEV